MQLSLSVMYENIPYSSLTFNEIILGMATLTFQQAETQTSFVVSNSQLVYSLGDNSSQD